MSTICRCDRCKKIIDEEEDYYCIEVFQRRPFYGYVKTLDQARKDFCAGCKDEILKAMMKEGEE